MAVRNEQNPFGFKFIHNFTSNNYKLAPASVETTSATCDKGTAPPAASL